MLPEAAPSEHPTDWGGSSRCSNLGRWLELMLLMLADGGSSAQSIPTHARQAQERRLEGQEGLWFGQSGARASQTGGSMMLLNLPTMGQPRPTQRKPDAPNNQFACLPENCACGVPEVSVMRVRRTLSRQGRQT
ncbi:hypothetical protein VFPPC_14862 [Pochonia chlamydosporia 170]|uniref:Uncharacterized protein n=1 Tax=Pochonia chlamydosporia 170 TaxID=1380566 RepID=A0A179F1A1_METCM|nr:hypothetical protein VFPPC_14862 [Pochonia chlamydosporia 170]OAQ58843.1 hypothetical protein VFPPC_14862 [Pochonia chlamydosporia 170]